MCFRGPDEWKMFSQTNNSSDTAQKSLLSACDRSQWHYGAVARIWRGRTVTSRRGSRWEEGPGAWFGVCFPLSQVLPWTSQITVLPSEVWITAMVTPRATVTGNTSLSESFSQGTQRVGIILIWAGTYMGCLSGGPFGDMFKNFKNMCLLWPSSSISRNQS